MKNSINNVAQNSKDAKFSVIVPSQKNSLSLPLEEVFTPSHCAQLEREAVSSQLKSNLNVSDTTIAVTEHDSFDSFQKTLNKITGSYDLIGEFNGQSLSLSVFDNISDKTQTVAPVLEYCPYPIDSDATGVVHGKIERRRKLTKELRDREQEWAYRKSTFAHEQNILELINRHGINNVGFLTLTFTDKPDWEEASRRWDNLKRGYFQRQPWWGDWILVREYQKRGSIHFHLLVAFPVDIRTGFNFAAVARRDYRSANHFLRGVWSGLRKALPKYGFGRHEVLPIRGPYPGKSIIPGTAEAKQAAQGMARYIGKYLLKSFHEVDDYREERKAKASSPQHRGWHCRYISYSHGAKVWSSKFQFFKRGGMWWRSKVRTFAALISDLCNVPCTWEGMKSLLGPCWVYNFGDVIRRMTDNVFENLSAVEEAMVLGCSSSSMRLIFTSSSMPARQRSLCLFKHEEPEPKPETKQIDIRARVFEVDDMSETERKDRLAAGEKWWREIGQYIEMDMFSDNMPAA